MIKVTQDHLLHLLLPHKLTYSGFKDNSDQKIRKQGKFGYINVVQFNSVLEKKKKKKGVIPMLNLIG